MSQNTLVLLTAGVVSGVTNNTTANAAFNTLATNFSGASAPATTYDSMLWADTTANILKMRNKGNTSWISLFGIDSTNNVLGTITISQGRTVPATLGGIVLSSTGMNNDFVSQGRAAALPAGWASVRILPVAGNTGLSITADTAQTANLFEVQNSSGSALKYINASGYSFNPVGSEGSPSVSFVGDTDTGMFKNGADTVGLAGNGKKVATFIGVASAVNYYQFSNSATGVPPTLYAVGSDTNIGLSYVTKGTGSHLFYGSGTTVQFGITSTASAANYIQVSAAAVGGTPVLQAIGSDANIGLKLAAQGSGPTASVYTLSRFSINNATTFDVASGTNDGACWDTTRFQISANGANPLGLRRRTSDGPIIDFRRDTTTVGSVSVTTTATAYNTSSDRRIKKDWIPLTKPALNTLDKIKMYSLVYKNDPEQRRLIGFLADELQECMPEAVTGLPNAVDENGEPVLQMVDYSKIVPLLIASLQELFQMVVEQKKEP